MRSLYASLCNQDLSEGRDGHVVSDTSLNDSPSLDMTRQLIFKAQVMTPRGWQNRRTLVDTGASACFASRRWVEQHGFTTMRTTRPIRLTLADGTEAGRLLDTVELSIRHGTHTQQVLCFITNIGKFDLILGMNWADHHGIGIHCGTLERSLKFDSDYCRLNCLKNGATEVVYDSKQPLSETRSDRSVNICLISARAAVKTAQGAPEQVNWVEPHHWETKEPDILDVVQEKYSGLAACTTQEDLDKYMSKALAPERSAEELRKLVPDWVLRRVPDVFNEREAKALPPRRPGVDHAIDLTPNAPTPRPKIYGLTRLETVAVKQYLDEQLSKGFIRPSTSPYAAPVLVVKKPGGGLRICVDYRALNAVTKKNRNAPPSIKETLARMSKVRLMSIVDVVAAFNTVRIKEGDEEKTAFMTRYGLFEYLVMPFGLCNAPGTFQGFMNQVLQEYLDRTCTAYLDDVLIYSENEDEHEDHVVQVLTKLRDAGLTLDPTKCRFKVKKVKYLGLILTTDGIEMDPAKVATVVQWPRPKNVKDVQAFLGFANFYRRFIKGFSRIAKALTKLTGIDGKHEFPLPDNHAAVQAFDRLRQAFAGAEGSFLAHFDPDKQTWLETDSSDFVAAAVLSQMDKHGVLRPVAFLSHKMTPAECNYEIYDKELLAIVQAFDEWRFELAGIKDPVKILTDHQALRTFMTNKRLNRRQARWAEFLSEFNFKITYRPGKQGTKPDALTRRSDDLPQGTQDERHQHQWQVLIKPHQVDEELRIATLSLTRAGNSRHAAYVARQGRVLDGKEALMELCTAYATLEQESACDTIASMCAGSLEREDSESEDDALSNDATVGAQNGPRAQDGPQQNLDASPSPNLTQNHHTPTSPPRRTRRQAAAEATVPAPVRSEGAPPTNKPEDTEGLEAEIRKAYPKAEGEGDETLYKVLQAVKTGQRRIPQELLRQGIRLELGACRIHKGLLYVRDRIYVPNSEGLRAKVCDRFHKTLCGGHGGKRESYAKISPWFYWPNILADVASYVRACQHCRRTKSYKDKKQGLLHPLPIPHRYWTSISLDYITDLPPCTIDGRRYLGILVIVDRLSKKKRFIPVTGFDVDTLVRSFVEYVWREEGYPEEVVSDRGSQFTSYFWQRLCARTGARPKLSTSFHPETDGQTENANAWLKQYLRAFVNYEQDNWALFLPIAEFVANSSINSTGTSAFYATKGYQPRSGLEPAQPYRDFRHKQHLSGPAKLDVARADQFAEHIETLRQNCRQELAWAQAQQAKYANQGRLPATHFKVGDYVMLDFRNIRTTRPNKSLDFKNRGPFKVTRVIDNMAYELALPPTMRIFPVFHPWLLHLCDNKGLVGQESIPEGPVNLDPDQEDDYNWEIEEVLDARINHDERDPLLRNRRGLLQYKVRWKDYPMGADNPTWEPYMNLVGASKLVIEYHRRNRTPPIHRKFNTLVGKQEMVAFMLSNPVSKTNGSTQALESHREKGAST